MTAAFSIDNPLASVSDATRAFLKREHKLFINGDWVNGQSERRRNVVDPATGQVISTATDANAADVDRAVRAAASGYAASPP